MFVRTSHYCPLALPPSLVYVLQMPLSDWRKPWYSVVVGSVFNIHFSTEFDFTTGSEQWQFIKSALNSVDSKATPWVFVNFHRPMYLSSTNVAPVGGDQTIAALLRLHVEPLFIVNGKNIVDLTLAGHHHCECYLSIQSQ